RSIACNVQKYRICWLGWLLVRLRLQPDVGSSRRQRICPYQRFCSQQVDEAGYCHKKTLLWLHCRSGKQLWGKLSMKDAALIIFQKEPESGKVKTRLATTIGDAKALATYQLLLKHTHEQVALLDAPVFVYFDKEIDPNYLLHPRYKGAIQATGDLGQRMKTAIVEVRTSGYQRVLVIGSDCPGLQVSILQEAFSQLLNHDLVLGPAKDGGYYLIGMKKTHQELFADIPWSSADVLSKTLAIAKSLHLHVFLLPTLTDVDVYEDLDEDLKRKLDLA